MPRRYYFAPTPTGRDDEWDAIMGGAERGAQNYLYMQDRKRQHAQQDRRARLEDELHEVNLHQQGIRRGAPPTETRDFYTGPPRTGHDPRQRPGFEGPGSVEDALAEGLPMGRSPDTDPRSSDLFARTGPPGLRGPGGPPGAQPHVANDLGGGPASMEANNLATGRTAMAEDPRRDPIFDVMGGGQRPGFETMDRDRFQVEVDQPGFSRINDDLYVDPSATPFARAQEEQRNARQAQQQELLGALQTLHPELDPEQAQALAAVAGAYPQVLQQLFQRAAATATGGAGGAPGREGLAALISQRFPEFSEEEVGALADVMIHSGQTIPQTLFTAPGGTGAAGPPRYSEEWFGGLERELGIREQFRPATGGGASGGMNLNQATNQVQQWYTIRGLTGQDQLVASPEEINRMAHELMEHGRVLRWAPHPQWELGAQEPEAGGGIEAELGTEEPAQREPGPIRRFFDRLRGGGEEEGEQVQRPQPTPRAPTGPMGGVAPPWAQDQPGPTSVSPTPPSPEPEDFDFDRAIEEEMAGGEAGAMPRLSEQEIDEYRSEIRDLLSRVPAARRAEAEAQIRQDLFDAGMHQGDVGRIFGGL